MKPIIPSVFAVLPVFFLTCCTARLNEVVTKLPQTEAYSRPMTKYTVTEVVQAAKPLYDNVSTTAQTVEISDHPRKTLVKGGQTISTSSLSLNHNGHRLDDGYTMSFEQRTNFAVKD